MTIHKRKDFKETMGTKECVKCGEYKGPEGFDRDSKLLNGWKLACKECHSSRKKNLGTFKRNNRDWRKVVPTPKPEIDPLEPIMEEVARLDEKFALHVRWLREELAEVPDK